MTDYQYAKFLEEEPTIKLRKILTEDYIDADQKRAILRELNKRERRVYAFNHAGGKR